MSIQRFLAITLAILTISILIPPVQAEEVSCHRDIVAASGFSCSGETVRVDCPSSVSQCTVAVRCDISGTGVVGCASSVGEGSPCTTGVNTCSATYVTSTSGGTWMAFTLSCYASGTVAYDVDLTCTLIR